MKRQRSTEEELKQEINRIVADTKLLGVEAKLRAIFALEDGNLQSAAWRAKDDSKFWLGVIKALDLVDYESVSETGNKKFGYPEITEILGQTVANKMLEGFHVMGLALIDSYAIAKSQFINYMLSYIDEAKFHFLVVYGYFLRVSDKLVPYEETKRHEPVCSSTSLATKPILTQDVTALYHVASVFKLVMTYGAPHIYLFYMKKEEEVGKPMFVIKLGKDKTHSIPMNGPITSVLKFYYADTFYITINGELDQKLLKFKYNEIDKVTVVEHFYLNPRDFDDVSYGKMTDRIPFATNAKSVAYLRNLNLVRQEKFRFMNPQPIRKSSDLTPNEKKLFLKAKQDVNADLGNRKLNPTELVIVHGLRPLSKPSAAIRLSDLSLDELRAITAQTGHVYVQNTYDYGRLFEVLKNDEKVLFVEPTQAYSAFGGALADVDYEPGALRCMATKILRLPFRTGVSPETLGSVYIAMLVRRYAKDGEYDTLLYLFRYRQVKAVYQSEYFAKVVLPPFVHRDVKQDKENMYATTYTITEMNLVFHTPSLFYVEVKERVNYQQFGDEGDDFIFVNSQLIAYDFNFVEKSPPILLVESEREREMMLPKKDARLELKDGEEREALFLDGALFEEVRKQNYKVHDYRHDLDSRDSKYDCIFYRYNVVKAKGRLIFYKKGDVRPRVADIYIDNLRPQDINTFMPNQTSSTNDLCLLNMARLVQETYETPEGNTVVKSYTVPQILKLVAVERPFPAYDKRTYNLSTRLQQSLTLFSSSSTSTHCIFCGQSDGVKDSLTNYHYCDRLCQRLFCKTNRF